jgi:hypothetical protein
VLSNTHETAKQNIQLFTIFNVRAIKYISFAGAYKSREKKRKGGEELQVYKENCKYYE